MRKHSRLLKWQHNNVQINNLTARQAGLEESGAETPTGFGRA